MQALLTAKQLRPMIYVLCIGPCRQHLLFISGMPFFLHVICSLLDTYSAHITSWLLTLSGLSHRDLALSKRNHLMDVDIPYQMGSGGRGTKDEDLNLGIEAQDQPHQIMRGIIHLYSM